MKVSTPRWWYRRNPPGAVTRMALTPLSWAWRLATARRIARGPYEAVGVPVISIGNLTVGGSGKTPVAREVLRLLREAGADAHGLSRGYGGSEPGPLRVDPTVHTASEVGDEPLMLAGDGPFWIARDRAAGARAAVAACAEAIVLDDGHQNPSLAKTLSLIVVDGETRDGEWPFGDGAVFPAGPMREPLAAGIARAGAVVLLLPADLPQADAELRALFDDSVVLIARLQPAAPPPPGPQLGFAGVAKPWKVARALEAAGCELIDFLPFPDHAAYTEVELQRIADFAEGAGAGLVTTEKDWVRLPPAWRERVTAWPVRAVFEDEDGVRRRLQAALSPP